jgi:hypothetical protein
MAFPHMKWLKKSHTPLSTVDGKGVDVWELNIDASDAATLSAWAKHFREHYCLDARIDELRSGTGLTREQFLTQLVFPGADTKLGPGVRSGDFAEILLADLLEDHLGFWVPRVRYAGKEVRDESAKGTDVLGFKFQRGDFAPTPLDTLIVAESKAQMSGNKPKARLQDAVADSAKDALRKSESLHAAKRKLLAEQRRNEALQVERFQDPIGRPYTMQSCAAAVFCASVFDESHIGTTTDCSKHPNQAQLLLVVVHSNELMKLVHAIYERAASEA